LMNLERWYPRYDTRIVETAFGRSAGDSLPALMRQAKLYRGMKMKKNEHVETLGILIQLADDPKEAANLTNLSDLFAGKQTLKQFRKRADRIEKAK